MRPWSSGRMRCRPRVVPDTPVRAAGLGSRAMLRVAGRVTGGLFFALMGIAVCSALLAATGEPDALGTALAFIALLLGFAGLAVARSRSAPWRPTRLALAIALLLSLLLILGLPWPPESPNDRSRWLIMAAALVASLLALLLPARAPRVALVLLAGLGVYGALILIHLLRVLSYSPFGTADFSPTVMLSISLPAGLGAAWVAALWHARALISAEIGRKAA